MVSLRVDFSHQAAKDLRRLDRITAKRVRARIEDLAADPFSHRLSRQIETMPGNRYTRVGDWRIIYQVDEAESRLDIVSIRPRSAAYR